MLRTTPKFVKEAARRFRLTADVCLFGLSAHEEQVIMDFARDGDGERIKSITAKSPIPDSLAELIEKSGTPFVRKEGAFVLAMEDAELTVYCDDSEGRQNGVMTMLQSLDGDATFGDGLVYDYPVHSMRGVKILMPGRDEIEDFKKAVDLMVFFRHNTLMIEVGGAMEYKRHPEINEGWVEYCAFMSEYSGKTKKIQESTYPWRKNSIHCNNGNGSYLTQSEVKEIIRYCSERNVKIIPEVPCTSHCDYMLIRHPELAERCEDPYPDTFCPSNPDSYKLLFDILDEVAEVFEPEIINIGHDEYYSINICDRCRKRIMTNADIYAEDVCRIHGYLASKGITTMLWCDKLMNVEEGSGHGGALSHIYFEWDPSKDLLGILRPTWEARYKLPKDIICLNWYYSFGEKYDAELKDFPVVFGNFSGAGVRNFARRMGTNGFGGIASNWGGMADVYFRRNCVYFSVAYNEVLYWSSAYDDSDEAQFKSCVDGVFRKLFAYRYRRELGKDGSLIEVTHSTEVDIPHRFFVDGVFPAGEEFDRTYLAGAYAVTLEDGTELEHPVIYGENLTSANTPWYDATEKEEGPSDDAPGKKRARITINLSTLAGETIPEYRDGKVICRAFIRNPKPECRVKSVTFKEKNVNIPLTVHSIKF